MLSAEFDARQARNRRYSLRAFARSLGTHHSTLGQLLSGQRRLTQRSIRMIGRKLGLPERDISSACEEENCKSIVRLLDDGRFRPDTRWISMMIGIPADAVNVSLQRLLFERKLSMQSTTTWTKGISE